MRTHVLNNNIPNLKQGEDRTNTIEILVPADMRSYSLFLFFALPDGSKTFTPKLTMTDNKVSYVIPAGITAKTGRVTVELQGYLDNRLIKSVSYAFFVVAAVSTPTEPPFEDFVPWYLEVMQKADQVETDKSAVTAMKNQIKTDETQRQVNELVRQADENERIENEIQRIENEIIRQDIYISKADKINTYTKTEVDDKDALLVPKTTTVNTKALSGNISVTAADVPNTPAGTIAATNVQAALNELDTEKANKTLPSIILRNSTTQSLTSGTTINQTFDTVAHNTDSGMRDVDTSKVKITKDGVYLIVFQAELTGNNTGLRTIHIKKNGTTEIVRISQLPPSPTTAARLECHTVAKLITNDYITAGIFQNSGVSLDSLTGEHAPVLSVTMIQEL